MQNEASICVIIVSALKDGETRKIPCRPETVGRIVRIRQNATTPSTINLCELEVYGIFGKYDNSTIYIINKNLNTEQMQLNMLIWNTTMFQLIMYNIYVCHTSVSFPHMGLTLG